MSNIDLEAAGNVSVWRIFVAWRWKISFCDDLLQIYHQWYSKGLYNLSFLRLTLSNGYQGFFPWG